MGNLREHAVSEMEIAGVDDDIYGDMTSKAVLELIDVFEKQGHSGMSASLVLSIFNRVIDFGNLTPLTNDPDEWLHHERGTWQSKRNSSAFSTDQGNSYYLVGESNWETDEHGLPYAAEAQAIISCHQRQRISYGSHDIFIGDVQSVRLADTVDPLIYLDGAYRRIGPKL